LPDICGAPDCGAFISDDAQPCPVCFGRGFNQSLSGEVKKPWTNADWSKWRDDVEEREINRLASPHK
jgi:hypothetical protein